MAKPAFDPNKPFDKVSDQKPAFDPNQPFETSDNSSNAPKALIDNPKASAIAALEHFGNAATAGYLPQLQAGAGKIASMLDPSNGVDEKLRQQGFEINQNNPGYVEQRDANIVRLAQEQKDNPNASNIGTGAGILASMLVPAGAGSKAAATLGGRALQAAKAGAVYGAVANPGDEQGVLDPIQADKRAGSALLGAVLGAASQPAVELAGNALGKAANFAKDKAYEKIFKAATQPTKAKMEDAMLKGEVGPTAQMLQDRGIAGPFNTPQKTLSKIEQVKPEIGKDIGSIIDIPIDKASVNPKDISARLSQDKEMSTLFQTPGFESGQNAWNNMLDTLAAKGDQMSLKDAQAMRQNIDHAINFSKQFQDMPGKQQMLYKIRSAVASDMADAAKAATGSDALRQLNKQYHLASNVEDLAQRASAGEAKNRSVSLTDMIAGATGLGLGARHGGEEDGMNLKDAGIYGLAAILANKYARKYGTGMQGSAYSGLSSLLSQAPKAAQMIKQNPAAFQILLHQLGVGSENQNTPSNNAPPILAPNKNSAGRVPSDDAISRRLQKRK